MKREVSISIFAVLIVAAAILTVYYLNVGLTGFAVFEQNTNSTFSEGTYTNVLYSGSAVVLDSNQTSGTYASKVFDGGAGGATWNNLTWQGIGVTFEIRNCTTADCSDANFTTPSNLNNLNLTGRYFQYKTSFDSVSDTLGSVTVDYTVAQQATPLSVSISEPAGEKTSLSALPLTFTIAGGTGTNLTCSYGITYAGGVLVSNTGISCAAGANTKTFDLANKGGDNVLTLYASDSSGNVPTSSGFSVSLPAGTITGETTEEETPAEEIPTVAVTQISLGEVSGVVDIIQGDSSQLTLSVQNTGTVPVTSCVLRGDDSGFVTVTDSAKDINPGEGATFSFEVSASQETSPEAYTLGLSVDCADGTTASREVTVNVLQKKLDFEVTNVQRTRGDRVRVDYSLTELSGENQNVEVYFSILDVSGLDVANTSQNSSVDANETGNFRVNIPVNEFLEGNLTLSAAFNSQVYSSSVLEPISLGAPIGGFAIFGGEGGAGGIIIVLIVALVIVAIFFVVRKMRQSGKTFGDLFRH